MIGCYEVFRSLHGLEIHLERQPRLTLAPCCNTDRPTRLPCSVCCHRSMVLCTKKDQSADCLSFCVTTPMSYIHSTSTGWVFVSTLFLRISRVWTPTSVHLRELSVCCSFSLSVCVTAWPYSGSWLPTQTTKAQRTPSGCTRLNRSLSIAILLSRVQIVQRSTEFHPSGSLVDAAFAVSLSFQHQPFAMILLVLVAGLGWLSVGLFTFLQSIWVAHRYAAGIPKPVGPLLNYHQKGKPFVWTVAWERALGPVFLEPKPIVVTNVCSPDGLVKLGAAMSYKIGYWDMFNRLVSNVSVSLVHCWRWVCHGAKPSPCSSFHLPIAAVGFNH